MPVIQRGEDWRIEYKAQERTAISEQGQRMNRITLLTVFAALGGVAQPFVGQMGAQEANSEFAPPFAVKADGAPIDISHDKRSELGHVAYMAYDNAFPWFGDFDGDGKPDLLVGQRTFGKQSGGRLRIYKNIGERGKPQFGNPLWFDDLVPTGRIPKG
jgi:hypothetical protein